MAVVAKDNVRRAQKKTNSALSLFTKAHDQVVTAEVLLYAELDDVDAQIEALQARKAETLDELDTAAKVKAKLSEFLA